MLGRAAEFLGDEAGGDRGGHERQRLVFDSFVDSFDFCGLGFW